MTLPEKIYQALQKVHDQRTFLNDLLLDSLEWPVEEGIENIEDISFVWTGEELRAMDLDEHIAEGEILQLRNFRVDQPWGIFILEFRSPDIFTKGRGIITPLRKVLRGLVPSRRKTPHLASWQRENLLFICTHDYRYFKFAYFKAPLDETKAAPLASFGWERDDTHIRTLCEYNLSALKYPEDEGAGEDFWLQNWASAFDVQKVTDKFFKEYHEVFDRVESAIDGVPEGEKRRLYTQRLLNRLMFLYFIEKKGWLEFQGSRKYLRSIFNDAEDKGENFLNDRLYFLFFWALSDPNPEVKEKLAIKCGKVPFLNGGLFSIQDYDQQGKVKIPNSAFAEILNLFERYNFTISESTPLDIEVAVDPEMLGKVFEELVTGRHASGSFYTPRPVVSFMCREALKGYLEKCEMDRSAIASFVDNDDSSGLTDPEKVLEALKSIKVCDPACGSGAYLLGMLQELIRLRSCLFRTQKIDEKSTYRKKLEIIQNNLYGVDLDEFAVNIAMLRLWLSLAIEFEGDKPEPLPNLDFKIGHGNSLIAPLLSVDDEFDIFRKELASKFDLVKSTYFTTTDEEEKKKLRQKIETLRHSLGTYSFDTEEINVFEWDLDFAEVWLLNNGFDVVVSNPPYVSGKQLGDSKKSLLSLYSDVVTGHSDLYCYFYARALQLLKPGGYHVFICSNSWLDAHYGINLKKYILKKAVLKAFYQSEVERQFSSAEINTLISILRKKPCFNHKPRFITFKNDFEVSISDPSQQKEYVFNDQQELDNNVEDHWGKYFRAPEIYWKLLGEYNRYFCKLGKYASVSTSNISPNCCFESSSKSLSDDCTKVINKPRRIKTIRIHSEIVDYYIKKWNIQSRLETAPPLIWGEFRNANHLCHLNEDRLPFTTAYFGINPVEEIDSMQLCLSLNSTLQWLFIEVEGRTALGAGAIRLTSGDLPKMTIIDPLSIKIDDVDSTFLKRSIRNVNDELQQTDRRALDEIIFDEMQLTQGERDAVYEAVIDLVEKRLRKARSV